MADSTFTEYIEDVYVTARVDSLEQEKARVLKEILILQQQRQPLFWPGVWNQPDDHTKSDPLKMESIFPPTAWPDIRHGTSDEAGEDDY